MLKNFIFTIIILSLSACAVIIAPSGGPEDKSAPQIINAEPIAGSLNFQDNSIIIQFNKYMDKNSVNNNIFISPSKKFEPNWSGKELEIEFDEPLDSNTTYAFSIGTDYTDIYGNKPEDSFFIVFSTGNYIDSGYIKGKVYGKEFSGTYIFAYRIDNISPDTLNFNTTKPDYRTQVGTSGNFIIPALKDGKYRLFSIKDQFKDEIYDETMDSYSSANEDIDVVNGKSSDIQIKVGNIFDINGPQLYNIEVPYNNLIIANFSEKLDTASISKNSFKVLDSSSSEEIPIKSAYLSPESNQKICIYFDKYLDTTKTYKLILSNDSNYVIKDSLKNVFQDTINYAYFYSEKGLFKDSLKIIALPFKDSTIGVYPGTDFQFAFNMGVNDTSLNHRISLYEDNNPIDFTIIKKSDNIYSVKPISFLNSDRWYNLSLKTNSLIGLNGTNAKDTTITIIFKTSDIRNFGSASGKVIFVNSNSQNLIVIFQSTSNKFKASTKINDDGTWELENLPPDTYTIEVFIDTNNNGIYDYGLPKPFQFSEKFKFLDKEITIKPRWKFEDIIINF